MPSRSLQDYRDEMAQQELQLRRLSEQRVRDMEEASRARERAKNEAFAEVNELRAELRKVSEKVQRRSSELQACERKSVSMQILLEELASELQTTRAQAGSQEEGLQASLHKCAGEAAALQCRVQYVEEESQRARAACQELSARSALASEQILQEAGRQREKLRQDFVKKESEINTEIDEERTRRRDRSLQHHREWQCKFQELEASEQETAQQVTTLEVGCKALQTRAEAFRGSWLSAERTRFATADEIASATSARDDAAKQLRTLLHAKSALVTKISMHGQESEERLQAELLSWQADRWQLSEEAAQVQSQTRAELEEHRRRCAAALRERLRALATKSREQDSRAEHRMERRLQACKHVQQRRLASEEHLHEERLSTLHHEIATNTTLQQREEATLLNYAHGLREQLSRMNQQASRWGDEEKSLEAELRGIHEEDFLQLQGLLHERSAEIRSLERRMGEDEISQSSERRELLAEIQAERSRAAKAATQPPRPMSVGIAGGATASAHVAGSGEEDPFEDLPELPSIPDFPPDFGDTGQWAEQSRHDDEAGTAAACGHESQVAHLKMELADRIAEINRLRQAATHAGAKLPMFRETEASLSEAEEECSVLHGRHQQLQEEVLQLGIVRDRLQDWDNELRDALYRQDGLANSAEDVLPQHDVTLSNATAGSSTAHVEEDAGEGDLSSSAFSRIAELEAELRTCIEQNHRAKKALSMHLEQEHQSVEPLSLAGRAKDLSPARDPCRASGRYTPKQRSSQRRMREMQLRKQEADAKRDAELRSRRRIGWLLPPEAPE